MPLVFRSMIRDEDAPKVGTAADMLGARVPADIGERDGLVTPGTGGISASRSWHDLPPWRIPIRFLPFEPRAAGKKAGVSLWKMGEGPFEAGEFAAALKLRLDSPTHAFIEPGETMPTARYQAALAATRNFWRCIDEELLSHE